MAANLTSDDLENASKSNGTSLTHCQRRQGSAQSLREAALTSDSIPYFDFQYGSRGTLTDEQIDQTGKLAGGIWFDNTATLGIDMCHSGGLVARSIKVRDNFTAMTTYCCRPCRPGSQNLA